jgi:hypothetical protein
MSITIKAELEEQVLSASRELGVPIEKFIENAIQYSIMRWSAFSPKTPASNIARFMRSETFFHERNIVDAMYFLSSAKNTNIEEAEEKEIFEVVAWSQLRYLDLIGSYRPILGSTEYDDAVKSLLKLYRKVREPEYDRNQTKNANEVKNTQRMSPSRLKGKYPSTRTVEDFMTERSAEEGTNL